MIEQCQHLNSLVNRQFKHYLKKEYEHKLLPDHLLLIPYGQIKEVPASNFAK